MSDIRDQLERRSQRFELGPDPLERLFDRRRHILRRRRITAAIVAFAIPAIIALGVFATLRGDRSLPANHPSPTPTAPTIPEGIYWTRPITHQEILRNLLNAGYTAAEARQLYFDPTVKFRGGWIRMGLLLQEGFWIQTARTNTGAQEAGWSGNYEIVGPHRVQAHDTGSGCTITYRFDVSGPVLTLKVLRETGSSPDCGPGDMVPQTAIFESAPFIRESGSPAPSPSP